MAPVGAPSGPIPWPLSPIDGRAPAALATVEPATHVTATVHSVHFETADTATLELMTGDPALLAAQPGQFVMVELPGFAIPPISISRIRPDGLNLTIRSVGPSTAALTNLATGAQCRCAAHSAAAGRSRPRSVATSSSSRVGSGWRRSGR